MSKITASRIVSSFADLPKLLTALVASPPDEDDPRFSPEVEHMRDDENSTSEITRGDVQSDLDELTVTDAFHAAFGDPLPLTIIEAGEEEGEHYMPEPLAAQADCGGIIATIFDLFADTRLDPLAPEIAWGFVNSFHFVTGKLERREGDLEQIILDMSRRMDASEVFTSELEQKQLECQSITEQRVAIGTMADYAAAMYRAYSGRPWIPAKGSKPAYVGTDSQIAAKDFIRARAEKRRDRYNPRGPIVVVSGPAIWHDWNLLWGELDLIHARIPNMVLVTTGQRTGVDQIAAAWAAQRGVPHVAYTLEGFGWGKGRGFRRNAKINELEEIVEAILCEGTGIQEDLYDKFNPPVGRRIPTHVFMKSDQCPEPPIKKKARRLGPPQRAKSWWRFAA